MELPLKQNEQWTGRCAFVLGTYHGEQYASNGRYLGRRAPVPSKLAPLQASFLSPLSFSMVYPLKLR